MIERRDFLTLFGGAAAAWPLAARAQQQAMPVIGYLGVGSPEGSVFIVAPFRKGLSESGYVEGRNVTIEYRWANNQTERLAELAADLVDRRVAVIVTPAGTAATLAAKAATATIPIVFQGAVDPVEIGLVASLNRPSGNVTGVTSMNVELLPKRLGLLHELVPGTTHFAALINPTAPTTNQNTRDAQAAASLLGGQIDVFTAGTNGEIDTAFATLVQKGVGALLVDPNPLFIARRVQLATLAAHHRLPAIYGAREQAEAGGLMSYGTSLADQYRQVGVHASRILKGDRPADLPVMRASKFEFVINLQTAKTLELTIPPGLLAISDEVIE